MSESNNGLATVEQVFISVQQGLRGWFCVMVGVDGPISTDDANFRKQADAIKAGELWARAEEVPFQRSY